MSDTSNPKSSNCAVCGKPVVDAGTGGVAHVGGGSVEQNCRNCGWSGGQYGLYSQCPRCGDATQLVNNHTASVSR